MHIRIIMILLGIGVFLPVLPTHAVTIIIISTDQV